MRRSVGARPPSRWPRARAPSRTLAAQAEHFLMPAARASGLLMTQSTLTPCRLPGNEVGHEGDHVRLVLGIAQPEPAGAMVPSVMMKGATKNPRASPTGSGQVGVESGGRCGQHALDDKGNEAQVHRAVSSSISFRGAPDHGRPFLI
jgi:hypothetical protein